MAREVKDFAAFMEHREFASLDYINGSAGPLLELSTTNDPATFFPPNGDCITGVNHVNAANEKGAEAFDAGSTGRFEIFQSSASGDLGYWTGLQHAEVRMIDEDDPISMLLRITEVFRREEGKWKLVHRHADMAGTSQTKRVNDQEGRS